MSKRNFPFFNGSEDKLIKKVKIEEIMETNCELLSGNNENNCDNISKLIEKLRPVNLNNYFGQNHIIGPNTVLGQLLEKKRIVSTILWGPPGCGKNSLANVIVSMMKDDVNFVKLSAISCGIQNVRDIVKEAVDENNKTNNKRKTILFMSEIHRFNKLQQDIFLPHIEAGTFVLIGATRENPSFSLNSALLSRCRVYQLEKLSEIDIKNILSTAVDFINEKISNLTSKLVIDFDCIQWLSGMCDGNAKIALNTLELSVKSKINKKKNIMLEKLTINDMKINLEKAYDIVSNIKTDNNHELVSAMHKSIQSKQTNAALYWLARLMATGEDPVYMAKRLIRIASEDIGISDPDALDTAVHAMHGCQMIGMPECDVFLAQCVIYLCRAQK
ncbi:hypothetical protein PV328_011552 [Microctonus aethiopoides]|uniref:AAA+ ATPase domain-containing protein n=1 Tax=Microctonus aethiopoides TaxID=144406 RepID=A0AA39EUD1_9HYME|nr:hypothetical protein PV328_011552 [Microctonus aethiopoides]